MEKKKKPRANFFIFTSGPFEMGVTLSFHRAFLRDITVPHGVPCPGAGREWELVTPIPGGSGRGELSLLLEKVGILCLEE